MATGRLTKRYDIHIAKTDGEVLLFSNREYQDMNGTWHHDTIGDVFAQAAEEIQCLGEDSIAHVKVFSTDVVPQD